MAVAVVAAAVAATAVRVLRVGWLMKLRPRRRPLLVHWARKLPPLVPARACACVRVRARRNNNIIIIII